MRKLAILMCFCALCGCGSAKTESGYTPRPLSMSDSQRRALYASPFSPEAQEGPRNDNSGAQFRPAGFGGY